jgi:hypothetical protein
VDPVAALQKALDPLGLALRGGFHPTEEDGVPDCREGRKTGTLLLVGNLGRALWPVFSRSPELQDGAPHALDRWTRRVLERMAADLGASALFPFGGPPWLPFQRWAVRAGSVAASPLRILIHPEYGLWQAYRAAIAFAERLALPGPDPRPRPCDSCVERPCLSACPVDAFTSEGYDAVRCRQHVASAAGAACREDGCLARRACPVGREHAYEPAQMAFHMRAFLAGPPGT